MIHHVSFGVGDPGRVAHVLAELTGGTAIRAPSPPFPYGAWFVVAGDDRGSLLEILPAASVFDPDAPLGIRQRPARSEPVGTHVLVSSTASREEIEAVAMREGWRAQRIDTGLFRIVKLWIDGTVLLEMFAKGDAVPYVETFGEAGVATLDARLRDLETRMADVVSAMMTREELVAALGRAA
jgi:hypothetical protein